MDWCSGQCGDELGSVDMSDQQTRIGTALAATATQVMLLGSGELGKVAVELQRLEEVIAVDQYPNAPAMQVATAATSSCLTSRPYAH